MVSHDRRERVRSGLHGNLELLAGADHRVGCGLADLQGELRRLQLEQSLRPRLQTATLDGDHQVTLAQAVRLLDYRRNHYSVGAPHRLARFESSIVEGR